MRVTWLAVCERFAHMVDGSHHALRLYLDPIPWRPPVQRVPLGVVFLIAGQGGGPVPVTVRVLNSRGVWIAELRGDVPGRPGAELHPGFMAGHAGFDAPGDYEVQALVDGQAVDDAPTWRLRFVPIEGASSGPSR